MHVRFPGPAAGRVGLTGLGAALTLTLAACSNNSTQTAAPTSAASPTTAVTVPTTAPTLPTLVPASPSPAASPTVAVYWPQEVEIPKIKIKALVVQVGLDENGEMEAPSGPDLIGWYTGGVAPGVDGNALITAHYDWLDRQTGKAGPAIFWDLKQLEKGDKIIINSEENKTFTYAVKDTFTVRFDDPAALKYLQPTDKAILTAISCEGTFDPVTRNYDLRRIVVAEKL